ncbi:hypothetical protein ACP3V3_16970 [Vibrio sp. PNB22_3_1]
MRELTLRFETTWGLGSELAFVTYQFEDVQAYRHFLLAPWLCSCVPFLLKWENTHTLH